MKLDLEAESVPVINYKKLLKERGYTNSGAGAIRSEPAIASGALPAPADDEAAVRELQARPNLESALLLSTLEPASV